MRVKTDSLLASISAFEFKVHTVYSGILEQMKPLKSLPRLQSTCLSPSSSPCLSSGNHLLTLFQKTIEGFDCKTNGWALGAALQHSLAGWKGEHKPYEHKAFPSWWQSLRAVTGSLKEYVLFFCSPAVLTWEISPLGLDQLRCSHWLRSY